MRSRILVVDDIVLDERLADIEGAVGLFRQDGEVQELRAAAVPRGRDYTSNYSGYFDDPAKLATATVEVGNASGIYVTLNPVRPELLARCHNKVKRAKAGLSTGDTDIVCRRWLPIDLDPVQPAGISSTSEEKVWAFERLREGDG